MIRCRSVWSPWESGLLGDRSLPLAWLAEEGAANIGFAGQRRVLERVRAWLPVDAPVMLSADRFYPSEDLFEWLHAQGCHYRLRLKRNLLVDIGAAEETTTGALAQGMKAGYLPNVHLFAAGVSTNIGILHETGHEEPWIIAMECPPTRAAVLDYGARWALEPTFCDFKGRGFDLEDSRLEQADRLERLILIMTLAMYGCVRMGREDTRQRPTPLEKKLTPKPTLTIGASENSTAGPSLGSHGGYVA